MAEKLTLQQKMAVENRGGRLLVSAAAGSGKTKVLVDRLLLYLTESNGNINIDDFLIITYTKAAAAELRGKIAAKLNERLAENPGNKHLQRQLQRLYLTKISTVHSFCTDILREYAYRLDIPGDFRVADERESQLIQLQVMDKLLDSAYENANTDFIAFVDSQELGRDDRSIPEIVLKVYNSARCHVDPQKWLQMCISSNQTETLSDVSETLWGKYLIDDLHHYLDMQLQAMIRCAEKAEQNGTMDKPALLLRDTISQLSTLRAMKLWDEIVSFGGIEFGTLRFAKNITDLDLAERIKAVRNACKKGIEKKLTVFADLSEQVLDDLNSCTNAVRGLVGFVEQFAKEYDHVKRSRRIMDFGDLEHKMLDLVAGKNRTGATAIASEIGDRFVEIMVDEYQDSNAVQDMIFSTLTEKRQNCFMVGDVKQSIYQFRLADPGIFLEKYHNYVSVDSAVERQGRKIMLSHNFRSAGAVIHAVNDVFTNCMCEEVGGLIYGEDELLREGIPHISVPDPEIEFCTIAVHEDTYTEEAAYTADKICQLLDGTHMVREGDTLRPIKPDDIVILLRSPNSVGPDFQKALESRGIRVNFGNGGDLLETEEVMFLRGMLQIIDNPLQDIPLLSVLTSRIICMNADELAVMRSGSRHRALYDSLKESDSIIATGFVSLLSSLRSEARLISISQLIERIISITKMESIVSAFRDGSIRLSNIQAFCKMVTDFEASGQRELGQFLEFLTISEEKGVAVSIENHVSGAVSILSIHKSKGLEYPVVFLCGLSRTFNRDDARAQILCHKEFGIGLNCVDLNKRIRYPSVAKKAIAVKILADGLSEEMRVLYVAMTRARDRMIMTYAVPNPEETVQNLVNRMDLCDKELLISGANCLGTWIMLTALRRMESGALFKLGGRPDHISSSDMPWKIVVESAVDTAVEYESTKSRIVLDRKDLDADRMKKSLDYMYPHTSSVTFPSKLTATQLKGRQKDHEASENAGHNQKIYRNWRMPSFASDCEADSISFGNTVHSIMQYLDLKKCIDLSSVAEQIEKLILEKLIDEKTANTVSPEMIWHFLDSDIGKKLRSADHVIREFKFSVLVDACQFDPSITSDQILLQGVIDCAMIEPEGITVIDFKTDRVTDDNYNQLVEDYSHQISVYAKVLSQIYQKEVKSAILYFFRKNLSVSII